jgi:hypothetical protein
VISLFTESISDSVCFRILRYFLRSASALLSFMLTLSSSFKTDDSRSRASVSFFLLLICSWILLNSSLVLIAGNDGNSSTKRVPEQHALNLPEPLPLLAQAHSYAGAQKGQGIVRP